jgi:hypothetical protein
VSLFVGSGLTYTNAITVSSGSGNRVIANTHVTNQLAGFTAITGNPTLSGGIDLSAGQDVTLNASLGSISGAGLVTADHVTADAASSLSLNLAANSLDATSAEGSVVVTDSGDLTLGTVTATGPVAITALEGDLSLGGPLTATNQAVSLSSAQGSILSPSGYSISLRRKRAYKLAICRGGVGVAPLVKPNVREACAKVVSGTARTVYLELCM